MLWKSASMLQASWYACASVSSASSEEYLHRETGHQSGGAHYTKPQMTTDAARLMHVTLKFLASPGQHEDVDADHDDQACREYETLKQVTVRQPCWTYRDYTNMAVHAGG